MALGSDEKNKDKRVVKGLGSMRFLRQSRATWPHAVDEILSQCSTPVNLGSLTCNIYNSRDTKQHAGTTLAQMGPGRDGA